MTVVLVSEKLKDYIHEHLSVHFAKRDCSSSVSPYGKTKMNLVRFYRLNVHGRPITVFEGDVSAVSDVFSYVLAELVISI